MLVPGRRSSKMVVTKIFCPGNLFSNICGFRGASPRCGNKIVQAYLRRINEAIVT